MADSRRNIFATVAFLLLMAAALGFPAGCAAPCKGPKDSRFRCDPSVTVVPPPPVSPVDRISAV